jgi:uncharacterized protein
LRDSGLLHYLLGISTQLELEMHPKLGSSWEGYAVEQIIDTVNPDQAYFWSTHSGAELNLLIINKGQRFGVDCKCKRVDAPRVTASMRSALDDLDLDHLAVIYPGSLQYPLAERVTAIPLQILADPLLGPDAIMGK